ncbi:uncharacterized protein CLUP02_05991 [Colletotrichum lupini]|uniref:Uncharacterized protein n=1 Tax=Colletotrichum lupini TaxID=145971 RepID=A0A9Q8SNU8_9PEZI|nr:uncharacterized protein CLUP02_05991 [Colletotrichum lupini]UQC80508.1 hypothetical protein CLUP02_05991 [Colletotrichum lupini]
MFPADCTTHVCPFILQYLKPSPPHPKGPKRPQVQDGDACGSESRPEISYLHYRTNSHERYQSIARLTNVVSRDLLMLSREQQPPYCTAVNLHPGLTTRGLNWELKGPFYDDKKHTVVAIFPPATSSGTIPTLHFPRVRMLPLQPHAIIRIPTRTHNTIQAENLNPFLSPFITTPSKMGKNFLPLLLTILIQPELWNFGDHRFPSAVLTVVKRRQLTGTCCRPPASLWLSACIPGTLRRCAQELQHRPAWRLQRTLSPPDSHGLSVWAVAGLYVDHLHNTGYNTISPQPAIRTSSVVKSTHIVQEN